LNDSTLSNSGLEALDYLAIAFYLLLTFGIALWFGRKQKDTEDYFVGGRRMPWLAVGLSILATLFSTITYLGMPGEMIKHGVGLMCGYFSLPLSFTVVMFLWVPFFMRLRLTSAYEYLEKRFNYSVRLLGATLFILLRLGWMSMVAFVASMALDRIKGDDVAWLPGPDLYWWIGSIGLIAAVYISLGGIQAVIWVDVLQCILLLTGVISTVIYVAWHQGTGPLQWWQTTAAMMPDHTTPTFFSTDLTLRLTVVTVMIHNFFWAICTHGSDQVVLQRYFSTSSLRAARRSYITNIAVDLTMVGLLSVAGLALLSFYLEHPTNLPAGQTAISMADKLFPHFLGHQMPAGFAGLIMSAFLCDAIQTLESGVNAVTAVIVKDFITRSKTPDAVFDGHVTVVERIATDIESERMLPIARKLTFVLSVLVAANAFLVGYVQQRLGLTIIDMMPRFFNMFVGPLAAMFFLGMFVPKCTARSLLPAVAGGLLLSVIYSWWDVIFQTTTRPTPFLAIAIPCVTTLTLGMIFSVFGKRPDARHTAFTWRAIMQRPVPITPEEEI
jgi:SSS family solute:Na+ symporter